jgi:hypothetical protein
VTIQEDDSFESMRDKILHEAVQEIDVNARRGGESAREINMMVGIAKPGERREQDAILKLPGDTPHDFAEQHAVGEKRQMVPMLFERSQRDDDRRVLAQRLDFRPRKVSELHGLLAAKLPYPIGPWQTG